MAPSFSPSAKRAYLAMAQIGLEITRVRIRLVNGAGIVVCDTTVDFPADRDTLNISVPIQISGTEEAFTATLDLTDANGIVLFSSTQVVTARDIRLPAAPPPVITLEFVGPGASARTVSVSPATGSVAPGASQRLTATATDAAGAPVSNLLVLWTSSDTTIARVVGSENDTANVQGTGRRGAVTFTARTLGGVSGTALLNFLPQPARLVAVSGGAQTGPAGRALPQPFVVQLLAVDSLGVSGQTVTFRGVTAGGAVTTATATTDGTGLASTIVTLGSTPGAYQFEAAAAAITATVQETAIAGAPKTFVLLQPLPATMSVGATPPFTVRATVADEFKNPVAAANLGFTVDVTVSPSGQSFTASGVSNSSGVVTLSPPSYRGAPGTGKVVFSSADFGKIDSTTIAVVAGTSAALQLVQQPPATASSGAPLTQAPIVQVVDVGNNPVSVAVPVTVSMNAGATLSGTTTVTSGSDGRAQFDGLVITGAAASYTLSFSSGTLSGATSSAIAVGPGAAAALQLQSGFSETGIAGSDVAIPPRVMVRDAFGNAVAGVGVHFAILTGGGTVGTPDAVTDAAGIATMGSWRLGAAAGQNTVRITVPSIPALSGTPADVSVTGTVGSPAQFSYVSGSGPGVTGGTTQVRVKVADAGGNPVSGRTITFVAGGGSGSVAPTTVVSDANGEAAATWTFGFVVGQQTVTATPDFTATAITFTSTVSAGASSQLKVVAEPSSATNGVVFSTQPQVQLFDASGSNAIAQSGVSVTVALAQGNGTLNGTLTATTDATGRATFTGLSITGPTGNYRFSFAASGFGTMASGIFTLSAGAPVSLALQPGYSSSGTAGEIVPVPPTVLIVDASSNPVPGVTVAFDVTLGSGSVGTPTVVTDANGHATVGSWRLGPVAGTNRLRMTVPSIPALSGTPADLIIEGAAAAPAQFTYVSGSGPGVTGGTTQVRVKVADANGNAVSGRTVTFAAGGGSGSVAPTSVVSDASGEAAATWTFGYVVGQQALTATPDFAAAAVGFTSTVSAGPNSQLKVVAEPAAATNGVAFTPQPQVQLFDESGNNAIAQSGVSITASIILGSGTLNGTLTATTDATGRAAFTSLSIAGPVGTYRLAFTASGFTSAPSGTFPLSAGAAASLTVQPGYSTSALAGSSPVVPPSVLVVDASGNPVADVGVTFAVTAGGGSISTPNVVTDASGLAMASGWTLGTTAGTNTLRATVLSLPSLDISVQGTAGAPVGIRFLQTPSVGQVNDELLLPTPVIQLVDAGNNPATGSYSVTATVSGSGQSFPSLDGTTTATFDDAGQATFDELRVRGLVDSYTLTFTVDGFTQLSTPISLVAGKPSSITIEAGDGQTASSGSSVPIKPQVRVTDISGNGVSGVMVLFTAENGSQVDGGGGGGGGFATTAQVVTDGAGIASLSAWKLGVGGQNLLRASVSGVDGEAQFTATAQSLPAVRFVVVHGDGQSGPAGVALKDSVVVEALDANGLPVANVGVIVETQSCCSGMVEIIGGLRPGTRDTSVTDSQGRVTFRWTMPSSPEGQIQVQVYNFEIGGVMVTASIQTAGVMHLGSNSEGSLNGVVGERLRNTHIIIFDDNDNIAKIAEHVTVELVRLDAPQGAGFTNESITMTLTQDGETDFSELLVNMAGYYLLRFTAPGITPFDTEAFTVNDP